MTAAGEGYDPSWIIYAMGLARKAQEAGEVPVGAVLVRDGEVIGEGWNRPITDCDPTAHAEIVALRTAGKKVGNYRLTGSVLYVTLEPCAMCAAAIVHARTRLVVFGAFDPRSGAAGSQFQLLPSDRRFNHRTDCIGGVFEAECGDLLKEFFRFRRQRLSRGIDSEGLVPSRSPKLGQC